MPLATASPECGIGAHLGRRFTFPHFGAAGVSSTSNGRHRPSPPLRFPLRQRGSCPPQTTALHANRGTLHTCTPGESATDASASGGATPNRFRLRSRSKMESNTNQTTIDLSPSSELGHRAPERNEEIHYYNGATTMETTRKSEPGHRALRSDENENDKNGKENHATHGEPPTCVLPHGPPVAAAKGRSGAEDVQTTGNQGNGDYTCAKKTTQLACYLMDCRLRQ